MFQLKGSHQRRTSNSVPLSHHQSITEQDFDVNDQKKHLSLQRQRLVSLPEDNLIAEGKQPPPRQGRVTQLQGVSSGYSDKREPINASKDCFVIPVENLERFLPEGITVRNTS